MVDHQLKKTKALASCCHDENSTFTGDLPHQDVHDHTGSSDSTLKMFLPALVSMTLLLSAVAFDHFFFKLGSMDGCEWVGMY